jgi:hypothetical protein
MLEDFESEKTDNGHIWRLKNIVSTNMNSKFDIYVCERCGSAIFDKVANITRSCDEVIAREVINK